MLACFGPSLADADTVAVLEALPKLTAQQRRHLSALAKSMLE